MLCSSRLPQPPFVRVIRPRMKKDTGYVMEGGGICMELLTPQAHMHMHGTCTAHAACRGMHGTCMAHAPLVDTTPT